MKAAAPWKRAPRKAAPAKRRHAPDRVAELAHALRQSRDRFQLALDAADAGTWEWDVETGENVWSDRLWKMYGLDAARCTASYAAWASSIHPEDLPAVEKTLSDAVSRGVPFSAEWRVRHPGRKRRWLFSQGSPVRDAAGRLTSYVGIVIDVTDRKDLEEAHLAAERAGALLASERRHRELLDLLPDGAIVYRDGKVVAANPAAVRLHGASSAAELLGRSARDLLDEKSAAVAEQEVDRGLAGLGMAARMVRIRRVDGSTRVAEAKGAPVPDDGHRTVQIVFRDLTERQEMEQALAVSSRLAAVGTLVAGVAHEINNPLCGALASHGFAAEELREARAALAGGAPLDRDALVRKLDVVAGSMSDAQVAEQRIARIVRDLVAFGRSDVRRERLSLRQVVDLGIRWVPASYGGHVRIAVVDEGAPDVEGLSGQLAQVVLNLVTNACKAGRDGRPPNVMVRIGPGRRGTAVLEVVDDGVGMPPEVLERIFDPFFTTRDVGQGMGLGLSVCHAIVSGHGGAITATSAPGRGSTFRVELPAAPSRE